MALNKSFNEVQLFKDTKDKIRTNLSACTFVSDICSSTLSVVGEIYPGIVGLCGAQGSGKSTISELVSFAMNKYHGRSVAILSLDDFYLPHAERQELARTIHPLCATRGVPGTHDIPLLLLTLSRLLSANTASRTPIPRFDKLSDDRTAPEQWPLFEGRPDHILLEGWCVGLPAHLVPPRTAPFNALEQAEDPDGIWWNWSIRELTDHYGALWKMLDRLVAIRLPDMETVVASRLLQERNLIAEGRSGAKGMSEPEVRRFVHHYERYTLALWDMLPRLADMIAVRDGDFTYRRIR